MTPTTLYLSGPMANLPDFNHAAFAAAATHLRALGHTVVSPTEHDMDTGMDLVGMTGHEPIDADRLAQLLMWDLQQVADTKAIAVLPGWEKSRGARTEVALAAALGKPAILYLTGINATPVLIDMSARDLHESIIADSHKRSQVSIDILPDTAVFNADMAAARGPELEPTPEADHVDVDEWEAAPAGSERAVLTWEAKDTDALREAYVEAAKLGGPVALEPSSEPERIIPLHPKPAPKDEPWVDWAGIAIAAWVAVRTWTARNARTAAAWARRTAAKAWAGIVAAATVYARLKAAQARITYLEDELKTEEQEHDITMAELHATRQAAAELKTAADGLAGYIASTNGATFTQELATITLNGTDPSRALTAGILINAAADMATLEQAADNRVDGGQ